MRYPPHTIGVMALRGRKLLRCRVTMTINTRMVRFVSCVALLTLAGCARTGSNAGAPILLFDGTGSSPGDVAAVARILDEQGLAYATADSRQLNGMSELQLTAYRLIIVPGGHYIRMGNSLTPQTTERIQKAVERGVNYLGICAGALLAGKARCNSFNLALGETFDFYAVVNRNIHKAAVPIACVDAPVIDQYWEDGPQLTGWGQVVGKYPDGTPAIVEGRSGQGWVILCGVHPEAPATWRRGMTFTTPASVANAYAATLIRAALSGTCLPHYE